MKSLLLIFLALSPHMLHAQPISFQHLEPGQTITLQRTMSVWEVPSVPEWDIYEFHPRKSGLSVSVTHVTPKNKDTPESKSKLGTTVLTDKEAEELDHFLDLYRRGEKRIDFVVESLALTLSDEKAKEISKEQYRDETGLRDKKGMMTLAMILQRLSRSKS